MIARSITYRTEWRLVQQRDGVRDCIHDRLLLGSDSTCHCYSQGIRMLHLGLRSRLWLWLRRSGSEWLRNRLHRYRWSERFGSHVGYDLRLGNEGFGS